MEPYSKNKEQLLYRSYERSSVLKGVFFLIIGGAVLLHTIPATSNIIPTWLYGFPSFLILLGIYKLVKARFNCLSGFVLILVGLYFMMLRAHFLTAHFLNYYALPAGIILVGIFYIFKRK